MRMFACAAALLLAAAGCDSSPRLYRVTGTVTWKGDPVDDGQIIFEAEDGQARPAGGKLGPGGKYELHIVPGKKIVRVHGQRSKGFDKAMNQVTFEAYIPAEFDSKSTITFDVQPNDDNVFDIKLPMK